MPTVSEKDQRNMDNLRLVHDALFAAGYHSGKTLKGKGTEYIEFFIGPGRCSVIAVQHYNNNDGFEIWVPIANSNRMDDTLNALTRATTPLTSVRMQMPTRDELEPMFEQAMAEERRYAANEYACVARGDHAGADAAHKMRWQMMDKAIAFLEQRELVG